MAKPSWALLAFLLGGSAANEVQTYIVQKAAGPADHAIADSLMAKVQAEPSRIIYHYDSLNAFAVSLTGAQAEALWEQNAVLAVVPDKKVRLHTTRTPEFLGLNDADLLGAQPVPHGNGSEEASDACNIIVGVIDTGAWPESESYKDVGMPDIPAGWKGACVPGDEWTTGNCNKKLIGARYFYKGLLPLLKDSNLTFTDKMSARDQEGHGSHTSSTVAGTPVQNASGFGLAPGTARGMAPRARLAIYKACWIEICAVSDVVAAIDAAIADGVHVISISVSSGIETVATPIPRAVLEASKHGIFVSMSAGNSGPGMGTVENAAPWHLSVGASTLDRDFPAVVTLGNGEKVTGQTGYSDQGKTGAAPLPKTPLPFISGAQAAYNASGAYNASLCYGDSLDPTKVAGKIVLCLRGGEGPWAPRIAKGVAVRDAGGRGFVLANTELMAEEIDIDAHLLPGLHIGYHDATIAFRYVNTTKQATATISFEGTRLGVEAPKVAAFSSRGPVFTTGTTLKPDVIAPGVNVLAAYSPEAPVLPEGASIRPDSRKADFLLLSGTSMSCPHMAGLAALLKARHGDWSPAAIRSAMVTTAYNNIKDTEKPIVDLATGAAATPYDLGGGHVHISRALDPGLVYDASYQDYVAWACTNPSLSAKNITYLANDKLYTCKTRDRAAAFDLNEPSFAAVYDANATETKQGSAPWRITYRRTATSVGGPGTYHAVLALGDDPHQLVTATVSPKTLTFAAAGDKQSYTVTVTLRPAPPSEANSILSVFGSLTWSDDRHLVRSPIAFSWAADLGIFADAAASRAVEALPLAAGV